MKASIFPSKSSVHLIKWLQSFRYINIKIGITEYCLLGLLGLRTEKKCIFKKSGILMSAAKKIGN